MATTSEEPQGDLLSRIEVVVACNICHATYAVPASIIRESQRILAEGCTGESLYECDASFFATLIEPEAIAELERAWAGFQQSATGHGGMRVTVAGTETSSRELDVEDRAVQRWENEGGRCEHARAAFAVHRARSTVSPSPSDARSARHG